MDDASLLEIEDEEECTPEVLLPQKRRHASLSPGKLFLVHQESHVYQTLALVIHVCKPRL